MNSFVSFRNLRLICICLTLVVPYVGLAMFLPRELLFAVGSYGIVLTAYLMWSYVVVEYRPRYRDRFSPTLLGVLLVGCTVAVILNGWVPLSAVALVHLGAIVFIFGYWIVPVTALYHDLTERTPTQSTADLPPITVLIPAYNEEGYVGRTISSLLQAAYPTEKLSIVVVDDGSTDGTYAEALQYTSETVTVVSKENGGKYSALNYGLLFADSEFVVTVDADSIVESTALRDIVAPLIADASVGAVASNVKIFNRDSIVTNCQTIEYVFSINIFRRAFDHLGAVSVVPGCLGAYRRSALEEVGAFDPHTLTEDFDTTLKILRAGYEVRFSEAVVYTEAPDTWRDLYRQRLRWYRGNVMTLRKHLLAPVAPDNRYLSRIHLPFALVSMIFTPVAGWVILGLVMYIVLTVGLAAVALLLAAYILLITVMNLLAIRLGEESSWYLLYSPLFVVGYKHFNDLVMLKSIVDVLRGTDLEWTAATRVEQ